MTHRNEPSTPPSAARRPMDRLSRVVRHPFVRRLGLVLAALVLLGLIASLVAHLVGRSRHAAAAERFRSELGGAAPPVDPSALLAEIASFAPQPVPELENAARFLQSGSEAIVWGQGERDTVVEMLRQETGEWSDDDILALRAMLERNRGGLELMARAVPLEGSDYGIDYGDIVNTEIPNLITLMNAGLLLGLDARLAFSTGRVEEGMSALETLSRLHRSLRRETLLIANLVAHVTEKLVLQGIVEVLRSAEPWALEATLHARLESLLPEDDLLDFSRRIVALDAAVVSAGILEGWTEEFLESEAESWLSRYFTGYWRAAAYLQTGRSAALLSHEPYARARERFDPQGSGKAIADLGPAYRGAVAKNQLAMSQRGLVRSALELRRLGLGRGAYPDPCPPLDGLRSGDPFVGEPLTCEPRSDGSLLLEVPGGRAQADSLSLHPTFWVLSIELPPVATGAGEG